MKITVLAHFFNAILLLWLIAAAGFLAAELSVVAVFSALVTVAIAFAVYRHHRWGYFCAAAWGLACYQLAKEELALELVKRPAMLGGFAVVVVALFLHEIFCRRPNSGRNSPQ